MNTRTAPVSALDLARADVVLTTYETLRGDLHHAPDAAASDGDGPGGTGGRASRHRKKYEIIPTPLTRLTWWRVVLDEAQEVESSTAAAAAMACLVPGVHRWAVTGTPVSRGVEDLQGLFAFLRAPSPLTDRHWFRRVVEAPFEKGHAPSVQKALLDVLRRVMWRNARADVADELRLPPQGQTVTALRPSGIEAHWYRKQREVCERAAREALRRVVDPARARVHPAAADSERNREGGTDGAIRDPRRVGACAAFAPGAGRRLGGRPDDDRDDGTGDDAFAIGRSDRRRRGPTRFSSG
jgi:E3 ubiquitin-protein ligase SHPRH